MHEDFFERKYVAIDRCRLESQLPFSSRIIYRNKCIRMYSCAVLCVCMCVYVSMYFIEFQYFIYYFCCCCSSCFCCFFFFSYFPYNVFGSTVIQTTTKVSVSVPVCLPDCVPASSIMKNLNCLYRYLDSIVNVTESSEFSCN